MVFNELGIIVLFTGAIAYIIIFFILVLNRGIHELLVRYLVIYILISFILDLFRTFLQFKFFDPGVQNSIIFSSVIVITGLSILLLKICSLILPIRSDNGGWFFIGTIWIVGLTVWIAINSYDYRNLLNSSVTSVPPVLIFNALAVFGWAGIMSRIVYLTFDSHRVVNRPLHKNRLNYWTISLLMIVVGDVLFFRNVTVIGSPIHLAGVSLIVYLLLTHNLIDIFRTSLQSLRYLLITIFAMIVYAILLLVLQPIIQERPGYNAFFGSLVIAAAIAFLINPIVGMISKRINRSLLGMDYDPAVIMREYSQNVNNIVDLQLLEKISLQLIKNTFGVDIGYLYVVEEVIDNETTTYRLNNVSSDSDVDSFDIRLDDPVVRHLSVEKLPLSQYDLDYHPKYRQRASFGDPQFISQEMDVYVPIHEDNKWIGLFALGPKSSGDRYYDEELLLLETIADQSAVALENAKLFTKLQLLNKELTQAREELVNVNVRLVEIDQLKSAFISVITHEMRTPISNLAFALQIFEMYGREDFSAEQKDQLQELHTGLNSARQMVDELVTFASFLNNQVILEREQFDMREILVKVIAPHEVIAQEKGVNLKLDMSDKKIIHFGDFKLISNAVYHLINNAVKFTQDRGTVIVSCWSNTEGLAFNVRDTGIGITPDRMENIWDAFATTSNPLQRGWEGLGLGLALVKFIVEAHGGRVWARSELNKGSVFGFLLPQVSQDEFIYPREKQDIDRT